jgi:phage shock protein C
MRRLYRSQNDRIIAGVCGGLGIHFGISPLLFRVLFILLSAAGGFAVPLYLIMWIVIPDAREVFTAHKSDTTRLNPTPPADWTVEPTPRGRADWPVLIGVVLVAIGLMVLLRNLGLFSWLRVLAPVAVIALGIALLIEVMNRQP